MGWHPRLDGRPNFRGIGGPFGSMHGRAKLTEALVTELRAQWEVEKYRTGFLCQWANAHGVSPTAAFRALVGDTWGHVKGAAKAHRMPSKAKAAQRREQARKRPKRKR